MTGSTRAWTIAAGIAASVLADAVMPHGGSGAFGQDLTQNTAAERVFDFRVEGGKLVAGHPVIRVKQNERVRLRWTAAEPVELHLHGYDIELRVAPGAAAEMAFEARATGRFPIQTHGQNAAQGGHHHGPALVYLEVYPP